MIPRWLLSLALALVLAGAIRAEDELPVSEEAFRLVCDNAMPFLLNREFEKAFGMLKIVSFPSTKEALDKGFETVRNKFEDADELQARSVEWKFVGSKKVGTVAQQFIYVCRYERQATFWFITGVEINRRWSMTSISFQSHAASVMESLSPTEGASNQDCDKVAQQIIEHMISGDVETAVPEIQARTTKPDHEEGRVALKRELSKISLLGPVVKCELVYSKNAADVFAEYCYVVEWNKTVRFVRVFYFHAPDEWKVCGMTYDSDVLALLSRIQFEPDVVVRQAALPKP